MKKASNWIILAGIILIIIVCIFKFANFHSLGIPNIESKYLWWGLGVLGIVILFVVLDKKYPSTKSATSTSFTKSISTFGNSLWGFVKAGAGVAMLIVVLGVLIVGLAWVKGSIENWTSEDNTSDGELVLVAPGSYTTIPIDPSSSKLDYAPPEMTIVEFLDGNENPLPIRKGGEIKYSSLSGPGIDDNIGATAEELRFIRFSTNSVSEYSFMFYQN